MKNSIPFFGIVCMITSCSGTQEQPEENTNQQVLVYPDTKTCDTVDTYFGVEVPDPYRWLENDTSAETGEWVKAQNECSFGYLEKIPYRQQLVDQLTEKWNYERISAPFQEGDYSYYYKNDGLQNHAVLYRKGTDGKEEIFLDPNTFSADGTTSLGSIDFSKDGSLAAYAISEGGSDWRKVIIMDTRTKKQIEDTLFDVKFSGISWLHNSGFYYSSYDKPKGSELSAKTDQHKLYFHALGTSQKEDQLIFGGTGEKFRYVSGVVSEDQNYLFISGATSTTGNKLYVQQFNKAKPMIRCIVDNFDNDHFVLETVGEDLYIATNLDAPNMRVVKTNASTPEPAHWVDFIPETENVLTPTTGGGYIFANYMEDAISVASQYDYSGKLVREIELPGVGTASAIGGKKEDETLYYTFTNYLVAGTVYSYDPVSGESKIHAEPKVDFDPDQYVSEQVFYKSKDGTRIPMIITHKKGLEMNGKNPTWLYGYGGFNVSLTPAFSISRTVWLEQGGVYAVPNLRGGGEYGETWHTAGTQQNKQNVFDDFIAAAEYLIAEKYTSSEFLAVNGGSNGGLLVGAVMTQRPELMRVALPEVGVLDMLRYHTFTAGAGWAYDYGTAEDSKEMFAYLKNYSPVHNVKEGVEYPATMVMTGDHDDRVVPAHSFKFAAELQAKQAGTNPVIIRIDVNAGHGAGKPVSMTIQEAADKIAFMLYNMGITELK
jgi:prolyl oligopeptidase